MTGRDGPVKSGQAAARITSLIADGTLRPGQAAPSAAELSRQTGLSAWSCQKALRALLASGVLVPGASPRARPRVAGVPSRGAAGAAAALSAALTARRRTAGLTQETLGPLIGYSATTIGHAETGRTWQSRRFWERTDAALSAGGTLLALHDACRQAAQAEAEDARAHAPAAPAGIVILWTDGAMTTVPLSREPPAPAQGPPGISTGEKVTLPHEQCVHCNEGIPGDCTPECHPQACRTLSAFIAEQG